MPDGRRPSLTIAGVILALSCAGCLTSRHESQSRLSAHDFSSAPPPVRPEEPRTWTPPAELSTGHGFEPERGGPLTIETSVGPPLQDPAATPLEKPRLVDSMVGDVNGNPIFAREFLSPMEGTLTARAREAQTEAEWRAFATQHIRVALDAQIANTLLREEALASLAPEKKQGLRYLLDNYRQTLISRRGGGSETRLQRKLEEQTGRTLSEELNLAREQFLIEEVALGRLKDSTVISMADVRNFYDRNYEQFNPPPTAHLCAIQVAAGDAEAIEDINLRLEAEEPFVEVAAGPYNFFRRDSGGRRIYEIRDSYESTPLFTGQGYEELDRAARSLRVGEWAGPIRIGDYLWWVHLERINEVRFSFYDMQLFLEQYMSSVRQNEAKNRLIRQLQENASFTSQPEMVQRLVNVAAEWYWAPVAASRASVSQP